MEHLLTAFLLFVGIFALIAGLTMTTYAVSLLGPFIAVAGVLVIILTVLATHA